MNWFKPVVQRPLNFEGCENVKEEIFWVSESKATFNSKEEAVLKNKVDKILRDLLRTPDGDCMALNPHQLIQYILENYDVKPKSQ